MDPAPAIDEKLTVEELEAKLLDESRSIFQRYRAMFGLRNMNTDKAVAVD